MLQAEVPQFLLTSAQQKNFPGVPRLAAEGKTTVRGLEHVWRGYEGLVGKFRSLGAEIEIDEPVVE